MPSHRPPSRHWAQTQQQQTLIELVLTLGTIIFFIWFAITPTLTTISQLLKEKQQLTEIKEKLNNKIENTTAALSLYDNNRQRLKYAQQALPDNHQVAEALAQIDILAEQNQLTVSQISFGQLSLDPEKPYQAKQSYRARKSNQVKAQTQIEIPWQIEAYGDYAQLMQFLSQLHNFRRVIIMQQITIDSQPKIDSPLLSGQLLLQVSGVIPYLPPNDNQVKLSNLN